MGPIIHSALGLCWGCVGDGLGWACMCQAQGIANVRSLYIYVRTCTNYLNAVHCLYYTV